MLKQKKLVADRSIVQIGTRSQTLCAPSSPLPGRRMGNVASAEAGDRSSFRRPSSPMIPDGCTIICPTLLPSDCPDGDQLKVELFNKLPCCQGVLELVDDDVIILICSKTGLNNPFRAGRRLRRDIQMPETLFNVWKSQIEQARNSPKFLEEFLIAEEGGHPLFVNGCLVYLGQSPSGNEQYGFSAMDATGMKRHHDDLNILSQAMDGTLSFTVATNSLTVRGNVLTAVGLSDGVTLTLEDWVHLLHVGDRKAFLDAVDDVVGLKSEALNLELRLRRDAIGQELPAACVWIRIHARPVARGERVVGGMTDITKQKEAEYKQRREENRLMNVLQEVQALIYFTDRIGHFTYINPYWEKLSGVPVEEIIKGGGARMMEVIHPDDRLPIGTKWHEALHNFETWSYECRMMHAEKGVVHVAARVAPLTDEDGTVSGFFGLGLDVTALKNAEMKLEEQNRELDAALKHKDAFLASVSHELRTPLHGILGNVRLLELERLPGEKDDYVATISICAEGLLQIVDDLLDFSRMTEGKFSLNPHPISLSHCCESAVAIILSRAREKGLTVSCDIDETVPDAVEADDKRLRQILVNLLSNATNWTEKGSIRLRVSLAKARDPVPGVVWTLFEVQDTGVGIPPANMNLLFQAFSLHDGGAKGGTGLGLAISKGLCTLMNGSISAESELGKGSTFSVVLPLSGSLVSTGESRGQVQGSSVSVSDGACCVDDRMPLRNTRPNTPSKCPNLLERFPHKILIAEDNAINQRLLRRMLLKLGYGDALVDVANNGREAVSMVCKNRDTPYSLVLMDISMPEMNGVDATKIIKREFPGATRPKIICVTAHSIKGERERYLSEGMDEYLSKPVRLEELAAVLSWAGDLVFEEGGQRLSGKRKRAESDDTSHDTSTAD